MTAAFVVGSAMIVAQKVTAIEPSETGVGTVVYLDGGLAMPLEHDADLVIQLWREAVERGTPLP